MTWLGESDAKRSSAWGGGATFCAAGVRAATANELVRMSLVCAATLVTAAFTRSTAATATALALVRVDAAGAGAAAGAYESASSSSSPFLRPRSLAHGLAL